MKNLWSIIDNPKIKVKEKMKAMNLMMQCHILRLKLVDSEAFIKQCDDQADKIKRDEEDNRLRTRD